MITPAALHHHLVIQSPTLSPDLCRQGEQLSQAKGTQRISTTALCLREVADSPAIRAKVHQWAQDNGIDYAFIRPGSKLAQYKVLALDMDATLINIECIDELADIAGVKDQVTAITQAAMSGKTLDFSHSLGQRVALLTGLPETALERVYTQRLRLNPGAEALIAQAQHAGLKVILISGGFHYFTDRLGARLNLDATYANNLEIRAGKLTGRLQGKIIDAAAKADRLRRFAQQHDAAPEQIIAIGDGANDLQMLALAGYSVAYHAKPIVQQATQFALNFCGLDAVLNWFDIV